MTIKNESDPKQQKITSYKRQTLQTIKAEIPIKKNESRTITRTYETPYYKRKIIPYKTFRQKRKEYIKKIKHKLKKRHGIFWWIREPPIIDRLPKKYL